MVALQEPKLVQRVEQFARATNRDQQQIVETAVQSYLDQTEREKIHAETEAFWRLYPELHHQYNGEYVAIYQGQVIDHDTDVLRLEQRVVE